MWDCWSLRESTASVQSPTGDHELFPTDGAESSKGVKVLTGSGSRWGWLCRTTEPIVVRAIEGVGLEGDAEHLLASIKQEGPGFV